MRSLFSWRGYVATALVLASFIALAGQAPAQTVSIAGNHAAETAGLTARVVATRPIEVRLILALHDEAALDRLIAGQHDSAAPSFRRWLTPGEFNRRFAPTQADYDAVVGWLKSQGVAIGAADREGRYIDFQVQAAEAERLFNVTIAASADGRKYANLGDPSIPARFEGIIAAVEGLDNLREAHPLINRIPPELILGTSGQPWYKYNNGLGFGPDDIRTFYDLHVGLDGSGQTIGIVEDSDWLDAAVTLFDAQFSLPPASITRVLVDGTNPGTTTNNHEGEALLDIEWAHAIAPAAALKVFVSDQRHPKIGDIVDSIAAAVKDPQVAVLSISFDFCGGAPAFYGKTLDGFFKQAVAQGMSVFVSSGDSGVDTCNKGAANVSEMAADPNVTGVGGTMFTPNYDVAGNDVGFVAENVWQVGTMHPPGGASGGGASAIFSKPSFQNGLTPADGRRDVPDVAMIAGPPGVYLGDDAGGAVIDCCWGGTSLAAPLFAGIFALINQNQGRVGNPDFGFYQLGPDENAMPVGLRDVTAGDNAFNGVPGFSAGTLYDLATGWGTPDIDQLIAFWKNAVKPPPMPVKQKGARKGILTFTDDAVAGSRTLGFSGIGS